MDPYQPVTECPVLPAGWRCTAYYWATHRGLPVTLSYLQELGAAAAREARWAGLERAAVPEGPFPAVLLWPPGVWAYAEAQLDAMLAAAGLAREQAGWLRQARQWDAEQSRQAAGEWGDPAYRNVPVPPARVVNLYREPYQVSIMRPGLWGNPFVIGRDGDRATVIAKHAGWIRQRPELMARLGELRGKVLGCCCKPAPCHGDTLAALADGGDYR